MQTPTLGLVATVAALGLVAVLFYTSRIRWYVALPLVMVLVLAFGAAQAQANTRVRWSMSAGQCYRYSVTEYRNGLTQGLLGSLWHGNERIEWCQTAPGATVWSGPTVHRSEGTNALWKFDGYQAKTKVKRLDNPRRWTVYAKWHFESAPNVFGIAENNYPSLRLTIYKANPSHVHYAASCGC